MRLRLVTLLPVLFACGCALGPDYERPDVSAPSAYEQELDSGETIANLQWWELFQDEELQRLITIAVQESQNVAIAAARVEEARARYGFVRADLFPRVDGRAGAQRGNLAEQILPGTGAGIQEGYTLAADLSWEVDIFGKLRRSTQAARSELLATQYGENAVIISLVADVASAYLLLRDLDAQREISMRTQRGRLDSLEIIQARFDKGTVPLLDVNQAEIEEVDATVRLVETERAIIQTENLLSVLLGRSPGRIKRGVSLEDQPFPPDVPAGLPSELLQRRPDVLAAEQQLAAQTARIGVAKALRWPSLSLTGSLGLASNDISDLLDSDSKIWSVGADFFAPIFNSGKLKRQVEIEVARTEQLLNQYELTVLQSLREVDDALAGIRTYRDESTARRRQVAAARSASDLSWARYNGGVASYLEVLETQRALFRAELESSITYRQQLVSIVQLYKALGGGWDNVGTTPVITPVPGSAPVSAPAGGTPQDSGAMP
jgi:multidrug efflux system outer membrane protein